MNQTMFPYDIVLLVFCSLSFVATVYLKGFCDGERKERARCAYYLPNVKGVARRKEGGQSEAKEGRCPPLPLPSCSLLSSSEGKVSFVEALERKMYRDMGVPESLYPPQLFRGDPASDDKQPQS
jgi:hypothetical protein